VFRYCTVSRQYSTYNKNAHRLLEGAHQSVYLHQVRGFNYFGAISIQHPKIWGVMWPWPCRVFGKFLRGHVQAVPGNMHIKFEVCIFNCFGAISMPKNLVGHMTLATLPFQEIFKQLRGHVWTVAGNMRVIFEVCRFNHFKLVWLTGAMCADTHTDTHIERKQYLRPSLCSLGRDNNYIGIYVICGFSVYIKNKHRLIGACYES